ncbi:origin recognition complex subunit 2 [Trametopsis cervina]|nr:origin recognition complex subunit 2 [Trametopsis cervina]
MDDFSEQDRPGEFQDDDSSDGFETGLGSGHDHGDTSQHTFANTAFDAYFALNHKPSRTSANVFSNIIPPLTAQKYLSSTSLSQHSISFAIPWLEEASRKKLLPHLFFELKQGFNLVFYGAGSKRHILNALATHISEIGHDVLVINAFNPSFNIRELLTAVENLLAVQGAPPAPGIGIDGQSRRIQRFLSSPHCSINLYIVIHNIDAPSLRGVRAKSCLSTFASHPRIHILASVDHIAFPILWPLTDVFNREARQSISSSSPTLRSPGNAWLFHELTTLNPYDFETTYVDRSSVSGASQASKTPRTQKEGSGTVPTAAVTEDAARHVLLSVTQRAKKLFVLLGTKQLEAMADIEVAKIDPMQLAFEYSMLFNMARDDFVATNDTALRALMGEFRDHGLMVSVTQRHGGAEAVWIPLRKDVLMKIIDELRQERV